MKDWIAKNLWTILIGLLTVTSSYTLYGYRINELEKRADADGAAIIALQQQNTDSLVALAKIQKDIEYIRLQIDRVFPSVK